MTSSRVALASRGRPALPQIDAEFLKHLSAHDTGPLAPEILDERLCALVFRAGGRVVRVHQDVRIDEGCSPPNEGIPVFPASDLPVGREFRAKSDGEAEDHRLVPIAKVYFDRFIPIFDGTAKRSMKLNASTRNAGNLNPWILGHRIPEEFGRHPAR